MKLSLRPFQKEDKLTCLAIFDSNCPPFFDPAERELFENFLDGQSKGEPVKEDIVADHFFVVCNEEDEIIACGGYYLVRGNQLARLSWGMVLRKLHKKGIGKELFKFRLKDLKEKYPDNGLGLDTSQHTFRFYEKMGGKVLEIVKDGYGEGLHKYEMVL